MNPLSIIEKYYDSNSELYKILVDHSMSVTQKALDIARKNPQENFDTQFIQEAAMLHDIGIFRTYAPGIFCVGDKPYICHGYLGNELLQKEGFPRHGLVCEHHTGTGISLESIIKQDLPLPHRDMRPVSKEEQLICFADNFFSKTKPGKEKDIERILKSLSKHGEESVLQFQNWLNKWDR